MAVIDYNFMAHSLMHPTTVKVVMPKKFAPEKTVYFLHGVLCDAQNCLDNVDMQKLADTYRTAFVIPSCGNMFYIDHGPAFGNYGKFVGSELVDVTRNEFGFSKNREDTAIAGFSMGGYGAIRNGMKYTRNFGYIIAMSPACLYEASAGKLSDTKYAYFKEVFFEQIFKEKAVPGPFSENYKFLIEKAIEKKRPIPKIYMTCGLEEELRIVDDEFSEYLKEKNIPHQYVKGHGEHDWEQWRRVFEPAVRWFAYDDL